MKTSLSHNEHYTEKFKENLNIKNAKLYCSIGADINGVLTFCATDNLSHEQSIMVLEKMLAKLKVVKN